ncbi:hypothetical protein IIA95_02275 [Patescibacteria group bacterium]|nr:hypothetical protein [Patescibacteria group bacterium]
METRLKLHRERLFQNSYTARFGGEWTLIYSEQCSTRGEVLMREKQLKSYRGREFVKQHIPG